MTNNDTTGPITKITMYSLFVIRAEYTNQDLQPVVPDWAQPSHVSHTVGIIAEAMKTTLWKGPPTYHQF
jgi:hypothetical protein